MISSIRAGRPFDLPGLVRHDVVVVVLAGEFEGCVALAELELVGRLGRATLEALEERFEAWWHDEDEERLGHPLLDRLRTLHVDLEDHVVAGRKRVADLGARCPIPVAMDFYVGLEELARASRSARNRSTSRKW